MIELIVIRHGETAWNVERRLQGHIDIPLNAKGRQQASALALALAQDNLDAIISSDLQRALHTAQIVAKHKNIPVQTSPLWRERCYGGFEGQLISTLEQLFPLEYAAWRRADVDTSFPGDANGRTGETVRQFHARIERALLELVQHYSEPGKIKKIGVVAHGGVLECTFRIAHQLPLHAKRTATMHNASINRFELTAMANKPRLTLQSWGDVTHLDNLGQALDDISAPK